MTEALFQKRKTAIDFTCRHHWKTAYRNVVAEYTKGKRETFKTKGDVLTCGTCKSFLFSPENPEYREVYLEICESLGQTVPSSHGSH